jgi:hypothetical protein
MDVFESGEDPQCHFPEEKKDDQPISSINFWGTAFQTQPLSQDSFCAKVHLGGQPKAWSSCWAPWLGYFISGAWPSLGTGDFFWCSQTCQWTKYWPWSTAFFGTESEQWQFCHQNFGKSPRKAWFCRSRHGHHHHHPKLC